MTQWTTAHRLWHTHKLVITRVALMFHHYVSVESCCTVVVKQCTEIYQNIQFSLF